MRVFAALRPTEEAVCMHSDVSRAALVGGQQHARTRRNRCMGAAAYDANKNARSTVNPAVVGGRVHLDLRVLRNGFPTYFSQSLPESIQPRRPEGGSGVVENAAVAR